MKIKISCLYKKLDFSYIVYIIPLIFFCFATGIQIVSCVVEPALRTIVENAGLEGSAVAKVAEGSGDFGCNAKADEYVDMLRAGIIDPKKVAHYY